MMTEASPGSAGDPRHGWFFGCCLVLAWLCCLLLWVVASLMMRTLPHFHGKPLPAITQACVDYRWWLLAFPQTWLVVAACYFRRRDAQATQLVKFSATLALALIALAVYVALILALPFLPISLC